MNYSLYMKTHQVRKISGKLVIVCVEDEGKVVYCLPDFLLPFLVNRSQLHELASRLDAEWQNPIRAIIEFEDKVRSRGSKEISKSTF